MRCYGHSEQLSLSKPLLFVWPSTGTVPVFEKWGKTPHMQLAGDLGMGPSLSHCSQSRDCPLGMF